MATLNVTLGPEWAALDERLRQLPMKIEKQILRTALRAEAKPIGATARTILRQNVTANERSSGRFEDSTGRLERSIRVRARRAKRDTVAVFVGTSRWDNLFTGDEFYGAFVEYGHSTVSRERRQALRLSDPDNKSGKAGRYVKPYPFIQPAFERHEASARANIIRRVQAGVEAAFAGNPVVVAGGA